MDGYSSMFDSKPLVHPSSSRGLRLTEAEERCMVKICLGRMSSCLVSEHKKSFWESMTAHLYRQTGRDYNWQSCKRRMMRILDSYRMYNQAVLKRTADMPLQTPMTYLEFSSLEPVVIRMLNDFFGRILGDSSLVGYKDESYDEVEEKQQQQEERKPINRKDKRIESWLEEIPMFDEVEAIKVERADMQARVRSNFPKLFAEHEQKYQPPLPNRNRSRSPCRAERKHRPRSRSPLARQQEAPVMAMATGALPRVKSEEQEQKPVRPLRSYETLEDPSPENRDPDTIQYSHELDGDAAMQFCKYMHPFVRKLTSHDPVLQNESLDLADSACRAMLESVVSAATKHITDNYDLKPRRR